MSDELKKRIILVVISLFISLVFFVVVFEVFLNFQYERWKSDFEANWNGGRTTISENSILMWEYRPNYKSNGILQTNRYGFRDYDYETMDKEIGVYRIAFIGDSVTYGLKVDSQNIFVRKFENYAKGYFSNLRIQAMNFGIDGYNIKQISELLTSRVLQFKPDKIVYVMCLNDFDFEQSSGKKIRYFNKPNSFVLEKLENLYIRYIRYTDYHIRHYKKNKQLFFDKIVEMKRLLLTQNIDFQIVAVPVFEWVDSNSFATYPLSEMHIEIGRLMTKEHIDFVDLLEAFRNQEKPPKYFGLDVWHPNNEGHDFIAKQLLQRIILQGLK